MFYVAKLYNHISLNPYFLGITTLGTKRVDVPADSSCLNPYFLGITTLGRLRLKRLMLLKPVLILIFLE